MDDDEQVSSVNFEMVLYPCRNHAYGGCGNLFLLPSLISKTETDLIIKSYGNAI